MKRKTIGSLSSIAGLIIMLCGFFSVLYIENYQPKVLFGFAPVVIIVVGLILLGNGFRIELEEIDK